MSNEIRIPADTSARLQRQSERRDAFFRAFHARFDPEDIQAEFARDQTSVEPLVAAMTAWIAASEFRGEWVAEAYEGTDELRGIRLRPIGVETDG